MLRLRRGAAIAAVSGALAGVTGALAGVAVLAGLAGAAGVAMAGAVPAKDRFSGRITSATGYWRPDHGRVHIELSLAASSKQTRRMTLSVRGAACGRTRHCLDLSGRMAGSITRRFVPIADIGASETVRGAGGLKPLGQTSLSGTIGGTGMIARGRETMTLTLATSRGTLTIQATSPVVPGFTVA